MDRLQLEQLREKLEFHRQEALRYLSRLAQETRAPDADSTQDSADRSVISLSKESLFERSSQHRALLRLIEAALHRIWDGSFGTCVTCGDDISPRRLQALPWTERCLRCQETIEREAASGAIALEVPAPWRRAG
jgi:DnaK suppressor protein